MNCKKVAWLACALACMVSSALSCMELEHVKRVDCPYWTYSRNDTGPAQWGSLCSSYATCSSGTRQSPINIISLSSAETDFDSKHVALTPHYYEEHNVTLLNNGHTLVISNFVDSPNILTLPDGTQYTLIQFHFHDRSEHLLDGKAYPLELHLVHNNSGNLAVLGFFFQEGNTSSPLIAELVSELSEVSEENEKTTVPIIELQRLIAQPFSFYSYSGSLTTPPCTENVKWFISTTVLSATSQQITSVASAMGINSRPAQPSNDRPIVNYHLHSSSTSSTASSLFTAVVFGFLLAFVIF